MKTYFKFIIVAAGMVLSLNGIAQCDNSLIEKAISKISGEKVFIREFTAKLSGSNPKKPEPVAKYTVYLQKDIDYYFIVENSIENKKQAIIQLYRKEELLASNFNFETGEITNEIEFYCNEPGMYRIYISFQEGEEGCAVVAMAMELDKENEKTKEEINKLEIIYEGRETPLEVKTDAQPGFNVEHVISKGTLFYKDEEFYILVNDTGIVELKTKVINQNGELVEETITKFRVVEQPEPVIMFHFMSGGLIQKSLINLNDYLEIKEVYEPWSQEYKIIEFKIGGELNSFSSFKSYNNTLTHQQYEFLQGLNNGDKFYIYDVIIKGPGDKIFKPQSLGFIMFE